MGKIGLFEIVDNGNGKKFWKMRIFIGWISVFFLLIQPVLCKDEKTPEKPKVQSQDKINDSNKSPLDDKYQLDMIRRKQIKEKLLKSMKSKVLQKEGLLNSSTMQLHVLSLRKDYLDNLVDGQPDNGKDQSEVSLESPFRTLDPRSSEKDNDIYFKTVLTAAQWIRNYRIKIGYYPYIPKIIRQEIVYQNRMTLVGRSCDKEGNCLYVFRYHRSNLKGLLDLPLE